MSTLKDLHRHWSKDESYKAAYDALDEEFQLARALIEARTRAGLSQTQLARRMKTSQSYVARIEGGQVRPSTDALERFAQATGTRLRITLSSLPSSWKRVFKGLHRPIKQARPASSPGAKEDRFDEIPDNWKRLSVDGSLAV